MIAVWNAIDLVPTVRFDTIVPYERACTRSDVAGLLFHTEHYSENKANRALE